MQSYNKIKANIFKLIRWGVLLYSLTVLCFYFSYIIPVKKQLVQLNHRIQALKQEVEQLKGQYVKKWENEKEKVLSILDSFGQKEGDKDVILSEIFKLSRASGIQTEKTEPLSDEIVGDTMLKYAWKINCHADYPAVGTFFNQIERSPLFLCLESPYIQSEDEWQKSFSKKGKTVSPKQRIKHRAEFLISAYRFK